MTTTETIMEIIKELQNYCDSETLNVNITHGDSFAWFNGTTIVKVNFLEDFQSDLFMENALKNGLKYDFGHFITALFHEIGHYNTQDWITKKEEKACLKAKKNLNGYKRKDNFKYFNTYDEKLATDWAIDYINENADKLNKLVDIINPLIDNLSLEDLMEIYNNMDENDVNNVDISVLIQLLAEN